VIALSDAFIQSMRCSLCIDNLRNTCKKFRSTISKPITIFTIVERQPHLARNLDYARLSFCTSNFAPPLDFIVMHSEEAWNWKRLSNHHDAPWLLQQMPGKPFRLPRVCRTAGVTIEWLKDPVVSCQLAWPVLWQALTAKPALSSDDLLTNPALPWDPIAFADNESLSLEFFKHHAVSTKNIDWSNIEHLDTEEMLELGTKPMNWGLAWSNSESFEERVRLIMEHVGTSSTAHSH
jgi:hypothetical protein